MKVVIIGSGNVATVLARMIRQAGHSIVQVVSRQIDNAATLADELGCPYTDYKGSIVPGADIYLVAIADIALKEIHHSLKAGDKLVVHTAGSVPMDILMEASTNYGVLYPLQSLRKENLQLHGDIPFLVDGNSAEAISAIGKFAHSISSSVETATDQQRLKLHIAAVFVSNFTNHLYALAHEYCGKVGVSFKTLQPLIEETALGIREHAPADMQTGPAVRRDNTTLDKHLRELAIYPKLRNVYLKMSDSIMNG